MTLAESTFLHLLSSGTAEKFEKVQCLQEFHEKIRHFSAEDFAHFYVLNAYTRGTIKSLQDQHWLQTHNEAIYESEFKAFLKVAFQRELKLLDFLEPVFEETSKAHFRELGTKAKIFHSAVIQSIRNLEIEAYRNCLHHILKLIESFTAFEKNLEEPRQRAEDQHEERMAHADSKEKEWPGARPTPAEGLLPNILHRAFDGLDEILGIDYRLDQGMKVDLQNQERLYEGAGVGVQSSYYTILTALAAAHPEPGTRWIDLGSGYGRVGLAIGLLRPDLHIDGYEYVGHRVELSKSLAEKVGISNQVHFHEQDLSRTDFVIPEAEVYYMYDPFSEETYRHVWSQLKKIGEKKSILIVTKGNAGAWFTKAVQATTWVGPEIYDTGNVHLFRSQAKPVLRRPVVEATD